MTAYLAKAVGRPVLYISFPSLPDDYFPEWWPRDIFKAAPYLDDTEDNQAIGDGEMWIVCEDNDERDRLFWLTVGDDGPTPTNPYDGPAKVYALTADADGKLINENT